MKDSSQIIVIGFTFLICICGCTRGKILSDKKPDTTNALSKNVKETKTECEACKEFNSMNTKVRDSQINKRYAHNEIMRLLPLVKEYYDELVGIQKSDYVFPLEGYGPDAIGGNEGSGYVPGGYSYFDGNKHKGHPAHDIFIKDSNQDCLDDRTGKPVNVLSMSPGIVVAAEDIWTTESELRGGKYIWIYYPFFEELFYYAHNRNILVKPGDIVKAGDKIAEVGRTGLNAYKERSPTHLHFSIFELRDGIPEPINPYAELLKSKTK